MAKKGVTLEEIEHLQELVEKRFYESQQIKEGELSKTQLYCLPKHDPEQPNLRKALNEDAKVRKFLESYNNNPYFKSKVKESENPDGSIFYHINVKWLIDILIDLRVNPSIRPNHLHFHIWALFIGYEDLDDFANQLRQETRRTEKGDWTNFKVFYYSILKKQVDFFKIQIDFTTNPFDVLSVGWFEQGDDEQYLEGAASFSKTNSILTLNLSSQGNKLPFNFIFKCRNKPEDQSFFWGIMNGVSNNLVPLSCEVILVREDHPQLEKDAKRILTLRRGHIKLAEEDTYIQEIKDIPVRSQNSQEINFLAGNRYLILGVYQKDSFFISTIEVGENLDGELHTAIGTNYEKQKVLFNISSVIEKRIQVTTVPKENNQGVICGWIVTKSPNDVNTGAFYHCGDSTPFAGYMAMVKISGGEKFEPKDNVTFDEIKHLANKHVDIKEAYFALKQSMDKRKATEIKLERL